MLGKLVAFLVLVGLTGLSSFLVRYYDLPIPAAIIGLAGLFLGLVWLGRVPVALNWVAQLLLRNLSLFFVPATVAVALFKEQLWAHAGVILLTLIITTLISLFITALIAHRVFTQETSID